jgi:hypothetical protein
LHPIRKPPLCGDFGIQRDGSGLSVTGSEVSRNEGVPSSNLGVGSPEKPC